MEIASSKAPSMNPYEFAGDTIASNSAEVGRLANGQLWIVIFV